MAPRKPSVPAKPVGKKVKNETNKVVKRPARGYHRHRNGFLNVRPKGREMDIVRSNQDSPLLRLPSEIRNTIWEYTLGHNTFRAVVHSKKKPRRVKWVSAPQIGFALLQTCRQIYMEAAPMPFYLNTFAAENIWSATRALKLLKSHERKLVKLLRVEADDDLSETLFNIGMPCWQVDEVASLLPALNKIDIVISEMKGWTKAQVDSAFAHLRHDNPSSSVISMVVRVVDHAVSSTYEEQYQKMYSEWPM